MKKIAILIAIALAVTTTGCGSSNGNVQQSVSSGEKVLSDLKIGFCVGGTLGDESTNDLQYAGLQRFQEETGCTVTALEAAEFNDHEINARNLADQGYDLVIMGLAASQDLVTEFAPDYPDTMFWLNQGTIDNLDNVACTRSMPSESNFLTGAFAVYMSEAMGYDKKVGWVGGQRNPALERGQYGFTAGAAYAGGEATIAYVGDFIDTAKGKELSLQMFNNGIHIIQAWAGGAGTGVMQASEENLDKDCYCMRGGSSKGDFYMSEESIIACATENADTIIYDVCKQFADGTLKGGVSYMGLKENACNIVYNTGELGSKIPDSVKEKVNELTEKIIAGELTPPSNEKEFNEFSLEYLSK